MDRTTKMAADQRLSDGRAHLSSLLCEVSNGSHDALAEVYESTSAKIYGICVRILDSEAEAQDVLQDVYVTVWRKASLFDSRKASAMTWLAVIARNKAIDQSRRRNIANDDLESAANVSDDRPSSFEIVQAAQEAARLRDCLDELEEQPRKMIRAAFLRGASYSELAKEEDVPLGTMKSWIRRGLQTLRGCLEQ